MADPGGAADSRLARRLSLSDAVVVGLGSMVGSGIFAALGPAAAAAGSWLPAGLALAGLVAFANATSSADLAARHPRSGGTYVYGRERLGRLWGYLAGWGFVTGKTASCAAMALTFGTAVAPAAPRLPAGLAVVALAAVNLAGVRKTAVVTRALVAFVLAVLALVVVAAVVGDPLGATAPPAPVRPLGVLRSAGLLFFAFAGYARIATLGEEVRDPAVTIRRAIPRALLLTLGIYAAVAGAALFALGAEALAASPAPLVETVERGPLRALAPVVRAGAALASLGVLVSLLAGVARTAFAMAAEGDLPRPLAAVSARARTPAVAELTVAAAVLLLILVVDTPEAIGFSAFTVLVYYAITNACTLTLPRASRRRPHWLPSLGLAGCLVLALTLPLRAVAAGLAVLALGLILYTRARVVERETRQI